jgi:hypothetical protein
VDPKWFAFGLGLIIGYVSSSYCFPCVFYVSGLRRPRAFAHSENPGTGNFRAISILDGTRSKIVVVEKPTRLFQGGRSTEERTFRGRSIEISLT